MRLFTSTTCHLSQKCIATAYMYMYMCVAFKTVYVNKPQLEGVCQIYHLPWRLFMWIQPKTSKHQQVVYLAYTVYQLPMGFINMI